MTLLQLMYFQKIAQLLNFHKASEELNVSQPTLSYAIGKLEQELGLYLFDRKGKNVELTKYGRYYYEQLTPLLLDLNALTEKVKRFASTSEGHIDIAYNAPLSREFIPKNVRAFLDQSENKGLSIHLHQTSSRKMIEGLSDGYLDVGFCMRVPSPGFITYVPILKEEILVITPLEHPLARKASVSLKELESYPMIIYTKESGLRDLIFQYLDQEHVQPQVVLEAPDEDAIAALVAERFGIAVVADVTALSGARVNRIPIEGMNCSRTLYMAYNSYAYLTPAVTRFLEFMRRKAINPSRSNHFDIDAESTPTDEV